MLYVDTSVLVALCTHEVKTAAAGNWYANCTEELISAAWCVTEFASALGIKQRTGQMTADQAHAAWVQFERICANDLELLTVLSRCRLINVFGAGTDASSSNETDFSCQRIKLIGKR